MKQPGEKAIVIYTRNCNSASTIQYIYSIIYIHIYVNRTTEEGKALK